MALPDDDVAVLRDLQPDRLEFHVNTVTAANGDSEADLARELEIARIAGAGDGAEGGAAERAVRIIQRRRIADVESLGAKLKAHTLRDQECFAYGQIRILQAWTAYGISRAVADAELSGGGEGGLVEPLGCAAAGQAVRIGDAIRALHSVAERRKCVGGLSDGNRIAGLDA